MMREHVIAIVPMNSMLWSGTRRAEAARVTRRKRETPANAATRTSKACQGGGSATPAASTAGRTRERQTAQSSVQVGGHAQAVAQVRDRRQGEFEAQ
jgi:hypothetical protein